MERSDAAVSRPAFARRCRAAGQLSLAMVLGAIAACAPGDPPPRETTALLADYAVSVKSFEVTPETAPRYFAELVPLATSGTPDNIWQLTGRDVEAGILWAVVEFQQTGGTSPSGEPEWELLQADIGLAPVDSAGTPTFDRLCAEVTRRLQRPETECEADAQRWIAWSLGPYRVGRLEEGDLDDPIQGERMRAAALTWTILQGEEE